VFYKHIMPAISRWNSVTAVITYHSTDILTILRGDP